MNGRAPNWPATGSHTLVNRKAHPNFSRVRTEFLYNSSARKAVIRMTLAAAAKLSPWATSSPLWKPCKKDHARHEGRALVAVRGKAGITEFSRFLSSLWLRSVGVSDRTT